MKPTDLQQLKDALAKASPAPWRYIGHNGTHCLDDKGRCIADAPRPSGMTDEEGIANAELITLARNLLPDLIAAYERRGEVLRELAQASDRWERYDESLSRLEAAQSAAWQELEGGGQ